MHIVVIAGIRSQFMKVAAMQRALPLLSAYIRREDVTFVDAGQHYDRELAGSFHDELQIDFNVSFKHKDHRPTFVFTSMIEQLSEFLSELKQRQRVDFVVVFGDANATLAGTLAAVRNDLQLVHVEAGLRTGNRHSPEELNRIIADHSAVVRFISSKWDWRNIEREGLSESSYFAGDLIYDLVLSLKPEVSQLAPTLDGSPFVLMTIHRAEHLGDATTMKSILDAIGAIDRKVLFITHPRTRATIGSLQYELPPNVEISHSYPYKSLLKAIMDCEFVVTDSGALQREAFYLRKRCVICQALPFWQGLVAAGIHRAAPPASRELHEAIEWVDLAARTLEYPECSDLGNGTAGRTILEKLVALSQT